MNLEQLPYKPGDIVRDRKTNTDYVVETIAGATLISGVTIAGIGLFNDRVETWRAFSEADMLDQHIVIRKADKVTSGAQIREEFRDIIANLLKNERDILSELEKDSNQGLKDLLLYGGLSELDPNLQNINVSILNLAESITTLGNAKPNERMLIKLLRESQPAGVTDEAIEIFAKNLVKFSESRSNASDFLYSESVLKDILLDANGNLAGDAITLAQGFGKRFTNDRSHPLWSKNLLRSILLGGTQYDPEGALSHALLGDKTIRSPKERIRLLSEKMFLAKNGQQALSETTRSFLDTPGLIDAAVKVANNKRVADENLKSKASLLIDALANWLIDPSNAVSRTHLSQIAAGNIINSSSPKRSTKLQRLRQARYDAFLKQAEKALTNDNLPGDYFIKATGVRVKGSALTSARMLTSEQIQQTISKATGSYAISKDAFYNSVIGKTRIRINNVEGYLTDDAIRKQLAAIDSNPDPFYVMSANQLRMFQNQVASNMDTPIDLTAILNEQGQQRSLIKESDLNALYESMIDLNKRKGTHTLVPLTEAGQGSPSKYVYSYENDGGSFYTTSLDTLKSQNASNISMFDVGQSRKGGNLHTRLAQIEANTRGPVRADHPGMISAFSGDNAPIGRSTTIQEIENILKSKNQMDKMRLLHISSNATEKLVGSYREGYNLGRLAVAKIQSNTSANIGQLSFVASEVNTKLDTQLARSQEYFNGHGILLDIESYTDSKTNLTKIKEIAVGNNNGISFSVTKSSFKNAESQAKTIITLTQKLQEQFDKGIKVVGTAGPHDFDSLIEYTRDLIAKVGNTDNLDSNRKQDILTKLQRSLKLLEDTQENKLFDVQVLYQLAGDKGISRQSHYTQSILKTFQRHTAEQDVIDLAKILEHMSPKIKTALNNTVFEDSESLLKKGLFIMSNDTLGIHGQGQIKRIMGTTEYVDRVTGKAKSVLQYMLYNSVEKDGQFNLVPTNVIGQDEYQSMQQMALSLQGSHYVFDEDAFNVPVDGETIAQKHKKVNLELQSRRSRSYNPASRALWDPTGEWKDQFGQYAAFKMAIDEEVSKTFPDIHKRYLAEVARIQGNKGEVSAMTMLSAMDSLSSYVDQLLENSPFKGDALSKNYFKIALQDVFENKGGLHSEDILNDDSWWNRFRASPAAQSLRAHMKSAIGLGNGHFGSIPDSTVFEAKSYFYTAAMADRAKKDITTAKRFSDIITETGPRLSLKMGEEATSLIIDSKAALDGDQILKHYRTLAAETMISQKPTETLNKALTQLGIGFEEFNALMTRTREAQGVSVSNLEDWKRFIHSIGWQGEGTEHAMLKNVSRTLIADNMQESLVASVQERLDTMKRLETLEGDAPTKVQIQRRINRGEQIVQQLADVKPGQSLDKTAYDLSKVLQAQLKENEDDFTSLMQDRYLTPPDISKLTKEEVTQMEESLLGKEGLLTYLRDNLASDADGVTEFEIMADVAHHVRTAEKIKFDNASHVAGRDRLIEIVDLHKKGQSFAQILSTSTRSSKAPFHEGVAKAVAEVSAQTTSQIKDQHALVGAVGDIGSPSKMYSKVSVPLLALGGIVGLLAAKEPNTGDTFHQGLASDSISKSFTGAENAVSKFSGIPGDPDNQQVWYGSTNPFRLNITFRGFVANKNQQDQLQREVYNILSSNMEVRNSSGEIQDNRNRQHRMAAVEALRGQI